MTKPSPAKKRKKETCKEGTNKQSKNAKRTKKQKTCDKTAEKAKKHSKDENIGQDQNEIGEEAGSEQGLDIDKELDKNASKSNLSVFNVKSIIHHVLSDERVLAMARNAAKDNDDDRNKDNIPEETHSVLPSIIEPKLTRSRVREVAQTTGSVPDPLLLVKETIIHSPLKNVVSPFKLKRKTPEKLNTPDKLDGGERKDGDKDVISEVQVPLVEISFSEGGSSDEEYDPLKDHSDGSEEDSESCVSNTSDLASPELLRRTSRTKRRLLVDSVSSSQPDDLHKEKEATALNTDQEKELVSPFKVPLPLSKTSDKKEYIGTDLIATRTRSRLPLTDTSLESLEAQFDPPDFSPDLYDVINLEDLEPDDIDWHKWLFALNTEKGATDTDDPEDTEYNFMAEEQNEEKEEYRTDRAVKISQKELTELFEEFLSQFDDDIPVEGTGSLQSQSASADLEGVTMTLQQRQCLVQQLQKHTQLLVQVAVLCKENQDLNSVTEICEGLLQDMVRLHDITNRNYVMMSMGGKHIGPPTSVFSFVGLTEALRIINLPRSTSLLNATPTALKPGDESRDSTIGSPISEEVRKILTSSPIFIYTGLLPRTGFHTPKTGGRAEKFLQCEDNLLVLGIDQYGHDWVPIKKHYLPVKTLNQIKIRRKNLCSKRCQDNVVKQYRNTGKIPVLPTIPAVPATEERHRPTILPAFSGVCNSPTWLKKTSEQQTNRGKKIPRRKKNAKNLPSVFAEKIPTIIIKDAANNTVPVNDVVSQPLQAEASKDSQFKNLNVAVGKTIARASNSSSQEKNRTILPKETLKIPTTVSLPNETLNRECSSPVDTPKAMNSGHSESTILQGSEKENIQPASEVPLCENVGDGNPQNLRTDTSEDIKVRAVSFAQSYLNNVKNKVQEDSPTYQRFLKVLVDSKSNTWSPAKLYKEIAVVLKDFPDLVRDFVGFLEPDQAVDAGVFMTSKEILKARTFLERVENHFQKNPAHFQKIIKAFATFNLQDSKQNQLYDAVIPLLKGQQHLIDEFNSFFDHLKPQPSHSDDFEEVELGSGSEVEVDDFEEVVIPDVKKSLAKTREFGKTLVKPASKNIARKCRRVKKDDLNDKNSCGNVIDYDKDRDGNVIEDTVDRPEEMNGICEDIRDDCGKALESDEDDEGYIDKVNSDCEARVVSNDNMSLLTKYASDVSNPSSPGSECKSGDNDDPFDEDYMESPGTTQESQVTSASEATSDLSNEALDIPPSSNHSPSSLAQCGNLERTDVLDAKSHLEANHENEEVLLQQEASDGSSNGRTRSTEVAEEISEERSRIIDKDERSNDLDKRISANNLEVDEDGKSVIIWTRENDKKILQLCQSRGFSDNIYEEIAQELGNKTAAQVENRFHILVSLLPDDSNVNSSSDQSGSESDDESCDETEDN